MMGNLGNLGYPMFPLNLKPYLHTVYGGFLKWWYPTTMGFPTKIDHFGGVLEVPIFGNTHLVDANGRERFAAGGIDQIPPY